MIKKTHLYTAHTALNAKMVNFHGWEMPIHYGSQLQEHHAVRNDAGMFDVSHMTILDILGTGCRQFLRKLLTHDVDTMTHNGQALYTCMCNASGGIIDDLIVYRRAVDSYRLILNSATREHDLAWIRKQSEGFSIGLQERPELAIIAVQGPNAIEKTISVLNPSQADAVSTLGSFEFAESESFFCARTGYTGESGFEIILPAEEALPLWDKLKNAGVQPCGLGARDTLRLEAGLALYGQDMDESTTPLESGLAWTVTWEPSDREFIGMGALLSQKNQGVTRQLVGLTLNAKGIMRHGHRVIIDGGSEGVITSGGFSPTLNTSIAFARIPTTKATKVLVEIRDQKLEATIGKLRFLPKRKP